MMKGIACTMELLYKYCRKGWDEAYLNKRHMGKWQGWGIRLEVRTLIGGWGNTNKGVEMPISVNSGGRADIMLAQTLETGGGGVGCGPPRFD